MHLCGYKLLQELHLLERLCICVSQILDFLEPVEHDALSVTYELLLIKIIGNTILRAHHKTTIGVSHVFYMLIHARVNLILKILLQAYVFLLILCLNHIFDPLNFDTTGIYFLCVKKVGRLATILSRLF